MCLDFECVLMSFSVESCGVMTGGCLAIGCCLFKSLGAVYASGSLGSSPQ